MSTSAARCPSCGAALRPTADRCWLCGAGVTQANQPVTELEHPEVIDAVLVSQETAATFSLTSLFLVMTLAAVAAGVIAAAPGLGVLFVVIALPALARTIVVTSKRKVRGEQSNVPQRVAVFFESTGLVLLVLIVATASLAFALFIACSGGIIGVMLTGFRNETPALIGAAIGATLALVAIGLTARTYWQQRKKRVARRTEKPNR